jgi:hypothetical protein
VKASRKQVLANVMFALVGVSQCAVARVEAFGQQQQAADATAVGPELARVVKFVLVTLWLISPYVLDLVPIATTLSVLDVTRRRAGS